VHYGQKTYNGVAILARQPPLDVVTGIPGDDDPQRRVIAATVGGIRLVNVYVPNGQAPDSDKYVYKLAWLERLHAYLADLLAKHPQLLVVGDFNIAPEDRDVHDPELWRGRVLASDPERERLRAILDWGSSDLLRLRNPEGGIYTWWDYQQGAFHRGWGLRIDLALGTSPVAERLASVAVDREERKPTSGEGKPSDHAPVIVELA
jgi:exodeoxyribonuclease-3